MGWVAAQVGGQVAWGGVEGRNPTLWLALEGHEDDHGKALDPKASQETWDRVQLTVLGSVARATRRCALDCSPRGEGMVGEDHSRRASDRK